MQNVNVERTLVFGCLHTPFQHVSSHEALLDFVKFWKPHRIIINGDNHDLWNCSRYFKFPERVSTLQDEADGGKEANLRLRKAAGKNCEIILNWGNHEYRYDKYLHEEAPSLCSLKDLRFEHVFGLDEANIIANRGKTGNYARLWLGPIQVGHFEKLSAISAYTERALVDQKGVSVIASHSHRKGVYYKTLATGKVLSGHGTGCLCDESLADYTEDPNWQLGFVIVEKFVDKDRYHITDMPVVGGNVLFNGKLF